MKLSWRDFVTTLLAVAGGAVVYAKFYEFPWAVIGSWRSAVAVLAGIGVLGLALSAFSFANRSALNVGQMLLIGAALVLAIIGMAVTSSAIFYILATILGILWLVNTTRHAWHSWVEEEDMDSPTFHTHGHVH